MSKRRTPAQTLKTALDAALSSRTISPRACNREILKPQHVETESCSSSKLGTSALQPKSQMRTLSGLRLLLEVLEKHPSKACGIQILQSLG